MDHASQDLATAREEPAVSSPDRDERPDRWLDRMVPRRLQFLVSLATLMLVAAVVVSLAVRLPIQDPDDTFGPSWVRLPFILLIAVLVDVVPRIGWRTRTGVGVPAAARAVLAERWTRAQVRFTLIGLVAWYVTYGTFRNLKNAVPFVNDRLWDAPLATIDRVLWLGNDPADVLHAAFGTGWAAAFFAAVYVAWIGLIPASLAWALAWTRNHAVAAWLMTALALDWALGVAAYYVLPTLGPIYTHANDFIDLPASATWLQASMIADRSDVLSDPRATDTLQTIAAFPSLHVGMMVTLCLIVQATSRSRLARVACWTFMVLTCLSTLYLGWHFFVDVLGGAVVGALAVGLGALATGVRWSTPGRSRPAPVANEPVVEAAG